MPPCSTACVETVGHRPHEVGALGDLQRRPQLVVRGAGTAVAQVRRDGAGEQVGPLRDVADPPDQLLRREVAHVHPVDRHRARGDVEQPRHQRHQRGLPRAGAADDGRGGARAGGEGDLVQHRGVRAGVAEPHPVEHQQAVAPLRGHRLRREGDRRPRVEHLDDALGADRGPRDHHRHERGHHDRHEDLQQVGQERRQRPDLHQPGVHPDPAEPQHRDAGHVEHEDHDREDQRLQPPRTGGDRREIRVRPREPGGLQRFADERPHHPDPADLLAQHPVDLVDHRLHPAEPRHHPADDHPDGPGQHRDADRDQPRQARVLPQRHDDPAHAHDRRGDQHRARGEHEHLHLLDVVRAPRDQRRGAEPVHLAGGELADAVEDRGARVRPEAGGGARAVVHGGDRAAPPGRG